MSDAKVEYRDVPGFPGYRVGNNGSVWSCWKRRSLGIGFGTESYMSTDYRQLSGSRNIYGYWVVQLRVNKKRSYQKIHILVLFAFCSLRPAGLLGLHSDDNKDNNSIGNLYWGTPKENSADAIANGCTNHVVGSDCHMAKLQPEQVIEIREAAIAGGNQSAIAEKFGICQGSVSAIKLRKNWKHLQ